MSHTSDFHARLKTVNRDFLDSLSQRFNVKSAAAALNKLLDGMRRDELQPTIIAVSCPSCKRELKTVNVNRWAMCPDKSCASVFTLEQSNVVYRVKA